jgi:sialate O-acetylesterase
VHPVNKYDSGRRLGLWALARDYGVDVVCSGPLYRSHEVKGRKMIIHFDYADGGLMLGRKNLLDPVQEVKDGKLTCVTLSADGKTFLPAETRIAGETLEVWHPDIDEPVEVNYCFENIPKEPFLYNRAGLPAAQFRTRHPGVAELKKGHGK